jgi:methionine-gamma-lyase
VLQRPAELGGCVTLHGAIKFLGDVMAGVVAYEESHARTLRRALFATGAVPHPLTGYLPLRGLATLPLRVTAASTTAADPAKWPATLASPACTTPADR